MTLKKIRLLAQCLAHNECLHISECSICVRNAAEWRVGVGILLNNRDKGKLRSKRLDRIGWSPSLNWGRVGEETGKIVALSHILTLSGQLTGSKYQVLAALGKLGIANYQQEGTEKHL